MSLVSRRMAMMVAALAIVGSQRFAHADVIVQHSGVADPATEGFSLASSSGFRTSPDPNWLGEDAWWTADSGGGALGSYTHALDATNLANMDARGWVAQMRVVNGVVNDDGTDYGVGLIVNTATRDFEIFIGTNASGNPLIYQWQSDGAHLIASTTLDAGYHTYSLVAGPSAATAQLRADGSPVATITGVEGTYTTTFIGFGSYWSNAKFNADYSQVSLTVAIPEPSVCVLCYTGLLGLLAYAWRRRK